MAENNMVGFYGVMLAFAIKKRRKKRRNRIIWTREWILKRSHYGAYHQLLNELRLSDAASYRNFLRMDVASFEEILDLVAPIIRRKDTCMRQAISPGERLALTLRFLATGETYTSMQYIYRIPAQTIGKIVPETCAAIVQALEGYMQVPKTEMEWKAIADNFETQWNFPHCIGALDGKHVIIRPPPNTGSYYFNYKHSFSIVLLALVDADYKFIYVDVGCNGRVNDGGVYGNSRLCYALESNSLNIPSPKPMQEKGIALPYMIVADDAFPLKQYIQKPYSQLGLTKKRRIFNYRLSRARRIVENAFGILANRFQVFMTPIKLTPEKAEIVVLACCTLHNFLRSRTASRNIYTPPSMVDTEDTTACCTVQGSWRTEKAPQGLVSIEKQGSNNYTIKAKDIRDYLCDFFSSEGAVHWQDQMI